MKIKIFGTRGSTSISNPDSIKYGGNTTCIRVMDDSIPDNVALVVDAGSGFAPMGKEIMKNNIKDHIQILFTHFHWDHTIGLLTSPLTFIKNFHIDLFGPLENGVGSKELLEHLMHKPYFPVDVRDVRSHFEFHGTKSIGSKVMLIHKNEVPRLIDIDHYELAIKYDENLEMGRGKYPLKDFIVVKMYRTNHPEKTISYRFENMEDGKVFVFLTDHENTDGISTALYNHCKDADLLIMDSQYTTEKYENGYAGFGHATPDYCVKLAQKCNVKKLGLTHHDPESTDKDIDRMVKMANLYKNKSGLEIFACADYMEIDI